MDYRRFTQYPILEARLKSKDDNPTPGTCQKVITHHHGTLHCLGLCKGSIMGRIRDKPFGQSDITSDQILLVRLTSNYWRRGMQRISKPFFLRTCWILMNIDIKQVTCAHTFAIFFFGYTIHLWRLPEMGGNPKSSPLVGCSIINHPFLGSHGRKPASPAGASRSKWILQLGAKRIAKIQISIHLLDHWGKMYYHIMW